MRKLSMTILLVLLFIGCLLMFGAVINHATAQEAPKKVQPVSTKDTIIKGVKYPLYVGARGGKYIIVTSKTGTQYKKYFAKK